ncbi:SdpI family protein [Hymenobacter sp. BT770]|uniref:SdpI family protein n=1 Tax=Hymenobacter sp. BT770 TaxID=2886942 RepID=UPI001D116A76|nr:SdpI family protein [Hymenobacter sp. BT770]MCC3151545.1 SdpI family protein [Hymenobacter sp. BT770]MDO3413879.1 SdpI family protein [Hymenobacter sp. BT770]
MKKNLLLWQLLTLLALVLPTAYLAYAWAALPAQVPTHFGLDGQPNGYTGREHLWLLTLALPLGLAVLLSMLPRLDPKHRIATDTANFQKLRLAIVGLISGLACYCIYVSLHPGALSGRGLVVIIGLFFTLLGNYLTTVQPNYFVGIRTPWTLESSSVWARTHRVGGILFCLAGLLMAALALVLPLAWVDKAMLGLILGTAAFCYLYSYLLFRQQERLGRSV